MCSGYHIDFNFFWRFVASSLYHIIYLTIVTVLIVDTIRLFILRFKECGNDGMKKNKARRKLVFKFLMVMVIDFTILSIIVISSW